MSLAAFVTFLEQSKYVLLFVGGYLEGPAAMLTGGLLWHLGVVSFWPAYLALVAADVLADSMWYVVGMHGARRLIARFGHFLSVTPDMLTKMEERFHRYHTKILVISKLTMGFGLSLPVLLTAGMLRVPFYRFFFINLGAGFVWTFVVMTIGYHFGNVLDLIPPELHVAATVAIALAFILALHLITKKLRSVEW